jgi:hypothetical protein
MLKKIETKKFKYRIFYNKINYFKFFTGRVSMRKKICRLKHFHRQMDLKEVKSQNIETGNFSPDMEVVVLNSYGNIMTADCIFRSRRGFSHLFKIRLIYAPLAF